MGYTSRFIEKAHLAFLPPRKLCDICALVDLGPEVTSGLEAAKTHLLKLEIASDARLEGVSRLGACGRPKLKFSVVSDTKTGEEVMGRTMQYVSCISQSENKQIGTSAKHSDRPDSQLM